MSYSNVPEKKSRKTRNQQNVRNFNNRRNTPERSSVTEGVYGNPRFIHVGTCLIGSVVQVQVRNGNRYEGIFNTFNTSMDLVLEAAHNVDEMQNNTNNPGPGRDMIREKIIFKHSEIVSILAANVDMEFAVRDAFTDAAIGSKVNGIPEREMRELEPWEGDDADDVGSLTEETSNGTGWTPEEMFKRNEKSFNVVSSYDDNLSQYTTPLDKSNTLEYQQREEEAKKLAFEIEKTDEYRTRIELENGESDEESKFSSVQRPAESSASMPAGGTGKYVPPHNRRNGQDGRAMVRTSASANNQLTGRSTQMRNQSPASRSHVHPPQPGVPPPHGHQSHGIQPHNPAQMQHNPQAPHMAPRHMPPHHPQMVPQQHQQSAQSHHLQPQMPAMAHMQPSAPHIPPTQGAQHLSHLQPQTSPHIQQTSPHTPMQTGQHIQSSPHTTQLQAPPHEQTPMQGAPHMQQTSPHAHTQPSPHVQTPPHPQVATSAQAAHHKPVSPRLQGQPPARDDYRLNGDQSDQHPDASKTSPQEPAGGPNPENAKAVVHNAPMSPKVEGRSSNPKDLTLKPELKDLQEFGRNFKMQIDDSAKETDKGRQVEDKKDVDTKEVEDDKQLQRKISNLNPNAKEFNPCAKPFQPKQQPTQTPTPPRPQTQSPVVLPGYHPSMSGQPFQPSYIMSQSMVPMAASNQPPSNQPNRFTAKRAVVSVHHRQDYTPTAQTVTGQPLLQAVQNQANQPQYTVQYVVPQPGVPFPGHPAYPQMISQRVLAPNTVPMVPTSHHGAVDPSGAPASYSAPTVYMQPPGGGAAMGPMQPTHPTPAHLPTHSQSAGQIASGQTAVTHPAPSPVQHVGNSQPLPPQQQQQPPTSGTPQPHITYPTLGIQGQPPLQPSPHNPTSPQATIHSIPLPHYFNGSHMQGHVPSVLTQGHHAQTSTGHGLHAGHVPQIVMMPQPGQMQHGGHQYAGQFPAHIHNPGHMHPQPHFMPTLPGAAPSNIQPMHYVHQVPSQGPAVQTYQQTQ